ncbi:SURF1 family protein [Phenylobacterium sp.]|uniref:SURF1 family protein n=1 Tax=Phenylobacterium sp. TaxID=1871053 RepID=UPI003982E4C1
MTELGAPRPRFPIGLTIATMIAFAILIWLGTWQLQRLAWKQDLLARLAALEAAPARPVAGVLAALARGDDVGFTRVKLVCPGLGAAPFLELYGLRQGQAGARLVSACAVEGAPYRSILVDRGFVGDTISARPPVDAADRTPVALVGVLREVDAPSMVTPANTPKRWFSRDIAAMARALGAADPAPIFLMAETSANPGWQALVPEPVPAEISNRHLEYALTWYGLAGALLAVYAAMLFKWRKS